MAVRASDRITLTVLPAVSYTRTYYLKQASTLNPPAAPTTNPPPAPWSTIEPAYTAGSTDTLYTVRLTVYGEAGFEYGPVQKDSSFEAAKQAYNKADAAMTAADGKNSITYTNVLPADAPGLTPTVAFGSGRRQYDVHRNRSSVDGTIYAEWYWTGSAWTTVHYGDNVMRSLDVGKLTVGSGNVNDLVVRRLAVLIATVIELNADRITAGEISSGQIDVEEIAGALAEFITVKAQNIVASEAGFGTAVIERLWTDFFATRKLSATEANLGSFVADTGFVEALSAAIVTADVFRGREFYGGTFTGATFRSTQESFEILLTGRGLTMLSKQAATVSRRWGVGGTPGVMGSSVYVGGYDGGGTPGIRVYNPATGGLIRTIAVPAGASPGAFAVQGSTLYADAGASGSTQRVRVLNSTGGLIRTVNIPTQALIYGSPTAIAAHTDGRIIVQGGASAAPGISVLSSTGTFQRRIALSGPRYGMTPMALHGDIIYEGDGKQVRLWNVNTGALITTWQVGPGYVQNLAVVDGILRVSLYEVIGGQIGAYVLGIDIASGSEVFSWTVPLAAQESVGETFAVDGRQYAVITTAGGSVLGELAVVAADTVQASMSAATGSVMFRDAQLRGTTTGDIIAPARIGGGPIPTELYSTYTQGGINVFETVAERDARLPQPMEGVEAVTLVPSYTRWRRRGGSWIEVETSSGTSEPGTLNVSGTTTVDRLVTGYITANGGIHVPLGQEINLYGNLRSGSGPLTVTSAATFSSNITVDGAVRTGEVGQSYAPIYFENIGGGRIRQPTVRSTETTANSNVYVGSNGVLALSTSTRRNKVAVETAPEDWAERLLEIDPRTWLDRGDSERYAEYLTRCDAFGPNPNPEELSSIEPLRRIPGLIAEEVEDAGLEAFVNYEVDPDSPGGRRPIGLAYDRLWTLLIPLVKRQHERLTALEAEVAAGR